MSRLNDAQQAFILEEFEVWRALTARVADLRGLLGAGQHLADVLAVEHAALLDSGMTREQIAAALVSILARLAQGEDLRYDTPQPPPPGQVLAAPPAVTPGALCPDRPATWPSRAT